MVFSPDGEQLAIEAVAQKLGRGILFLMAKPLLRSETQRLGVGLIFRWPRINAAAGQDRADRDTNGTERASSHK